MRPTTWFSDDVVLLDGRCPLPLDRPFTSAEARRLGVSHHLLRALVARGLVREVVRGAYVAAQIQDTIECRAAALSLVVPESAVVVDRTAAWLHDVDVLPRRAVHEPVPLDVFSRTGSRLRRPGVDSGIRSLSKDDVTEVHGIPVTTKVRTALDLGRLLRRYDAIGALDALVRAGASHDALVSSLDRFKGFRGVVQLRELVPLADKRAESIPESALRLHWLDGGLVPPEPQVWVHDEAGVPVYRLDLAVRALKYGVNYQGERFHTGADKEAYDEDRMVFLQRRDWVIDDFWKDDLYGPHADPVPRLNEGIRRARLARGAWKPQGAFLN